MLLDIYQVEYMHKEYERRIKAELLVREALKARAARADVMTHGVEQGSRWGAAFVTTLWRRGRSLVRRGSGQHDAVLSLPIDQKFS